MIPRTVYPTAGGKSAPVSLAEVDQIFYSRPARPEVYFYVDTLAGETILATLGQVARSSVDDDLIYIGEVPCRLSSARPVGEENRKRATAGRPTERVTAPLQLWGYVNRPTLRAIEVFARTAHLTCPPEERETWAAAMNTLACAKPGRLAHILNNRHAQARRWLIERFKG